MHVVVEIVYYINGKSGAGKSTVIQMLGLLLKIDDGAILLKGKDTSKLRENGFVSKNYIWIVY